MKRPSFTLKYLDLPGKEEIRLFVRGWESGKRDPVFL